MNGSTIPIPTMKVERVPTLGTKTEVDDFAPSPYMEEDDVYEDTGDLDFSDANQQIWLSHIPASLWEALSTVGDDEEVDIGTIRIETQSSGKQRTSLKLNRLPQLQSHPKEYNLHDTSQHKTRPRRAENSFIFSEKDLPGYKGRSFMLQDPDDEYHGRSFLYEKNKREMKRKENKKRFEPYARKSIPKQTAITGVVTSEYECKPVQNEEYWALERRKTETMLKLKERPTTSFTNLRPANFLAPGTVITMQDKSALNKAQRNKKQTAKDNRTARVAKNELIDRLLKEFKVWSIWRLRGLRRATNQPEAYLREVLSEIAFMHKNGDWSGMWQLKPEYREQDAALLNPEGLMAPDVGASDVSDDEDEDNEIFEDVA